MWCFFGYIWPSDQLGSLHFWMFVPELFCRGVTGKIFKPKFGIKISLSGLIVMFIIPWQHNVISLPKMKIFTWNFWHDFTQTCQDDPWCRGWPNTPRLQSGFINILQVWLWGQGVLDTLLIMLDCQNLAHISRNTWNDDPWCQWWPNPPRLQSGTINIFQVWLQGLGVLDTLRFMLEHWNLAHNSRIT